MFAGFPSSIPRSFISQRASGSSPSSRPAVSPSTFALAHPSAAACAAASASICASPPDIVLARTRGWFARLREPSRPFPRTLNLPAPLEGLLLTRASPAPAFAVYRPNLVCAGLPAHSMRLLPLPLAAIARAARLPLAHLRPCFPAHAAKKGTSAPRPRSQDPQASQVPSASHPCAASDKPKPQASRLTGSATSACSIARIPPRLPALRAFHLAFPRTVRH